MSVAFISSPKSIFQNYALPELQQGSAVLIEPALKSKTKLKIKEVNAESGHPFVYI